MLGRQNANEGCSFYTVGLLPPDSCLEVDSVVQLSRAIHSQVVPLLPFQKKIRVSQSMFWSPWQIKSKQFPIGGRMWNGVWFQTLAA